MPTTTLITIPSPTALIASVGSFSSPIFDNLIPIALVLVGIAVGAIIVSGILHAIPSAIARVFNMRANRYDAPYHDQNV